MDFLSKIDITIHPGGAWTYDFVMPETLNFLKNPGALLV